MKLRNLLIPTLLVLGLSACNEESITDYSGTYKTEVGTTMILEKIKGNEYKLTKEYSLGGNKSKSVYIKNNTHLYDSRNEYQGEFMDKSFKNTKGTLYSKIQ